jgi:hypothetical protein
MQKGTLLHQNNKNPYPVLSVVEYVRKHDILVAPHPPCSQDFAPCDYLFPKMTAELKGRSDNKKGITENMTRGLRPVLRPILPKLAQLLESGYSFTRRLQ